MYKFRVQIYIIKGNERACQKSYGIKNLVKLEGWRTYFKITLGTGVFKKSCSKVDFKRRFFCYEFEKKIIFKKLQYKIKRNVILQKKNFQVAQNQKLVHERALQVNQAS